ncbi:6-carboxyhexanoate--CoA ligase [Staphylococcus pettenkoferi]|uniref:6-carboxyhexanoate--CoA ligase n=1 Tax=Staphylococcus pettenkoferi TaxID=170573 RepID=UPI00066E0985|nr:6-carboxyhexanoate--CoA ligase [Staphylococcus pettenkoferi]MCI2802755.1 6-carboxyhexanoate--CoA ligase [Staphylococcus pettenkoferi]MCY1573082.1 6-carboxyhexanoate--CoA ligase [Staphylococcus pettenkoferi]MCY1579244.1 6-carboxyhexanoate--CoA ligase [Staphylococcus pettenkoferi]MCY1585282.1 6-carboxyhexanoate--CoA ligase [Staphylococcus pettenkoferi]MCY1615109.1 6-carboxyhexanoate--CoA ligase [Staphylococcus pettenkoferi]
MFSVKMRASQDNEHISGAETICEEHDIETAIQHFFRKGFNHQNGKSDFLNLKIEQVKEPLIQLSALQIIDEQHVDLMKLCTENGITKQALERGLDYIHDDTRYTGALILSTQTGERLDQTGKRGVRATRFCFNNTREYIQLKERVQDSLSLATILTHHDAVHGELCVSDDMHYTTGYFATKRSGYHRLYNVKEDNSRAGGRIVFVEDSLNIEDYTEFLELVPKQVNY